MREEKIRWLVEVLEGHQQWFPTSCAASGMEILLKFEKKIGLNEYPLQERYAGNNIGFEKIGDLGKWGIQVDKKECDLDILKSRINSKSKDDKIILFSAPTILAFDLTNRRERFVTSNHIFVGYALSSHDELSYQSKTHLNNEILNIHNIDKLYHSVRKANLKFLFDYVSY